VAKCTKEAFLDKHLVKCYLCQYCNSYKRLGSGHDKTCNEASVEALKEHGILRGYSLCPICNLPFRQRLNHLKQTHNMEEKELERFRLVAKRAHTPEETLLNAENLKAARKKVRQFVWCTNFWTFVY
jgi:hypothetical protein